MGPQLIGTLHHEHLVRINDPANVVGQWLTRNQLWEGLRHTILAPQSIDPSIDRATVRPLPPDQLCRELHRGSAMMADRVVLLQERSLTIHADANSAFAGSTLRIDIEEPAPGMLFVRFTYDLIGLESDRTDEEDAARRAAYLQSDIERIRQARKFVAQSGTQH
jgi:Domain of unknown function (DUF1857)